MSQYTYAELQECSFDQLKVIKDEILDNISDLESEKRRKIGEILYLQDKLRDMRNEK